MEAKGSEDDEPLGLDYADCLAAARSQMRAGKTGKAFPWYLLAVQLVKDAAEKVRREKSYSAGKNAAGTAAKAEGNRAESSADTLHVVARGSSTVDVLDSIEPEVVSMFIDRSTSLMEMRSSANLFATLDQASSVLSCFPGIIIQTGIVLARLKMSEEASVCFVKAIKLEKTKRNRWKTGSRVDRSRLPLTLEAAVDGLRSLVGTLVPRWHFRMLNDVGRNAKFADAIVAAVRTWKKRKGDEEPVRVLDIGAGTGLLSMIAARQGCDVTACELDSTMHSVAEEVLEANDFLRPNENNLPPIRLLKSHSNDIVVHGNERFDFVVTETLDCGVFGEGIVSTLHGAWTKLLKREAADEVAKAYSDRKATSPPRVIPAGVKIFVRGFESPSFRRQIQYEDRNYRGASSPNPLAFVARNAVVVAPNGAGVDSSVKVKGDGDDGLANDDQKEADEPYTTLRLDDLDDLSYVTSESLLAEVAFDSEDEMRQLATEGKTFVASAVEVTKRGTLDGIAVYFEAILYRGGSGSGGDSDEVCVSTRPRECRVEEGTRTSESCWEQAVYAPLRWTPSQRRERGERHDQPPSLESFQLCEDQTLIFQFRLEDDLLELSDVRAVSRCKNADDGDAVLDAANLPGANSVAARESHIGVDGNPLALDSFLIHWLNSSEGTRRNYRQSLVEILSSKLELAKELRRESTTTTTTTTTTVRILERTEGLPIVGLEAVDEIKTKFPFVKLELIVIEDDESKVSAVRRWMRLKMRNVGAEVHFFKTDDLNDMEGGAVDAVILDVIDKIGLLQCGLESLLFRLSSSGIVVPRSTRFVPSKVRILAEAVESQRLLNDARVQGEGGDNKTTLGFDVATSMNLFRNQTHAGLTRCWRGRGRGGGGLVEESRTNCIRLTEAATVFEFETEDLCRNQEMRNCLKLDLVEKGDLHAFVHWFQLVSETGDRQDVIFDSGDKDVASPWVQAAFLVDEQHLKTIRVDKNLEVRFALRNGRIMFSIL